MQENFRMVVFLSNIIVLLQSSSVNFFRFFFSKFAIWLPPTISHKRVTSLAHTSLKTALNRPRVSVGKNTFEYIVWTVCISSFSKVVRQGRWSRTFGCLGFRLTPYFKLQLQITLLVLPSNFFLLTLKFNIC